MKRTTFIIIAILFFGVKGICCSCFSKGIISVLDFNSYDWIFIGQLISEHKDPNIYKGRQSLYKIIKAYKGVKNSDTVSVYDAEDLGACGLGTLKLGSIYLIYARGDKMKWTNDCTRTTLAPNYIFPQDSAAINTLKNLHSFGRVYQTSLTNFYADTIFLNKHILKVPLKMSQTFLDDNGKVFAKGQYRNGLPNGFWQYYKNGKATEKGNYKDGKKDSMWVEPYSEEMVYLNEYKDGEYTFKQILYYDGRVSSRCEPIGDGKKWIKYEYHSNGKIRYVAYCNPPKRDSTNRLREPVFDGPFKMYNRLGFVLEEGNHKDGVSEGKWQYFYEDGKLRMTGSYIEGEKAGTWTIYYPNKKIKAIGEYNKDEKLGEWKFFNSAGIPIPPDPKSIEEDEDWFTYSGVKH